MFPKSILLTIALIMTGPNWCFAQNIDTSNLSTAYDQGQVLPQSKTLQNMKSQVGVSDLVKQLNSIDTAKAAAVMKELSQRSGGGIDGGGGVGVRCSSHGRATLELLDMYEAHLAGLHAISSPTTQEAAIDQLAEIEFEHGADLNEVSPKDLSGYIQYEKEHEIGPIFAGSGIVKYVNALPLATDIGEYHLQSGCELVQIAFYYDKKPTLYIVKALWDQLDRVNQMALVEHELVYSSDRKDWYGTLEGFQTSYKATSERTRKYVGKLLSTQGLSQTSSKSEYTCMADNEPWGDLFWFDLNRTPDGQLVAIFQVIYGDESSYRVSAATGVKDANEQLALYTSPMVGVTVAGQPLAALHGGVSYGSGQLNNVSALSFNGEEDAPRFTAVFKKSSHHKPTIQVFKNTGNGFVAMGPETSFICQKNYN